MKLTRIATVSAVMMLASVMFSACNTGVKDGEGTENPAATEKQAKDEPAEAVEIKTEEKAEKPAEPAATPAPAPAEETQQPVLVPEQAEKTEKQEPAPAPAAKEEKKPALPCDHVVQTGDSLWKLAREYYGEGTKWKLIFDANKAQIKNENFLEPGKVLKIPAAK